MRSDGVPAIDIAAMEVVRGIVPSLRSGRYGKEDIDMILYSAALETGVDGMISYAEEEKKAMEDQGKTDEAMAAIKQQLRERLVPHFNDLARDGLDGKDLFIDSGDGILSINLDVDMDDMVALDKALFPLWHPDGRSRSLCSAARTWWRLILYCGHTLRPMRPPK